MGLRRLHHTLKPLCRHAGVVVQVLFHAREQVSGCLGRLAEHLLILLHALRHLLLDVLLTADDLSKALGLQSGHGRRALDGHAGLVNGFGDARGSCGDLA